MNIFDQAFAIVVGEEGGYDRTIADPGNWTGGRVGSGQLLGTKYGISGHAYPKVDIAGLTLDDAKTIYQRDYWLPACCDQLPPRLAVHMFDAAVNSGLEQARTWLQEALEVKADGVIGPITLGVAASCDQDAVAAEFDARRVVYDAALGTWKTFGLGWARRITALPYKAAAIAA